MPDFDIELESHSAKQQLHGQACYISFIDNAVKNEK